MASTLNARIALRRSTTSDYISHPDFKPLKGEVCFEDTQQDGLKVKIGDGEKTFQNLSYEFIFVVQGYYYNDEFYYDELHSALITKEKMRMYIDLSTDSIYYYNGYDYIKLQVTIGLADEYEPGIMKLYKNLGQNEDGTLTQKSITDGLFDVQLTVEGNETLTINLWKN